MAINELSHNKWGNYGKIKQENWTCWYERVNEVILNNIINKNVIFKDSRDYLGKIKYKILEINRKI